MIVVMVLVEQWWWWLGDNFMRQQRSLPLPQRPLYHDLRSTLFRSSRIRNSSGQEKVYLFIYLITCLSRWRRFRVLHDFLLLNNFGGASACSGPLSTVQFDCRVISGRIKPQQARGLARNWNQKFGAIWHRNVTLSKISLSSIFLIRAVTPDII